MKNSLSSNSKMKTACFALLAVGILCAYFLTDIVPFTYKAGAAELVSLQEKHKTLGADLTKARQTVHSQATLEKEHALLQEKWKRAQELVPDEQEMASLLRAMTLLGDRSEVEFLLFRPLPTSAGQYHTEHPVEVRVAGGYHDVGRFLSELSNMERMVLVGNLVMETNKKKETDKSAIASFVAKTYTLGGTGVPPEDPSVAGKKKKGSGSVTKQANKAKESVQSKVKDATKGGKTHE